MNCSPVEKTVIFSAPAGFGKTQRAADLQARFGCLSIVDEWRPLDDLTPGALHLTNLDMRGTHLVGAEIICEGWPQLLQGDRDLYAPGPEPMPGRFMPINGKPSPMAYARLIEQMQKAVIYQRLAQNAAVAAGLGGSELEKLLRERADAADALFNRVEPALFLQAQ